MADVVQSWAALQPIIEEAARKERDVRLAAWLDFPRVLCGEECNQLTLSTYTLLESAGNAFVCGGIPGPGSVAQFVWFLSTQFTVEETAKKAFLKRIAGYSFTKAVAEIRVYLEEVFFDLPPTRAGSAGPSDRLFTAALIHRTAKEYGWAAQDILAMPLQQIFQLVRCQARDNGATSWAPYQDEVRAKFLEAQNGGRN